MIFSYFAIRKKYKNFLKKTIGKSSTKKEMHLISQRMKELDSLSKVKKPKNQEVKSLYDEELSSFWEKIVSYENKGDEIALLCKNIKLNKSSEMLSIASGISVFEMFIAKEFLTSGKIVCIDFSEGMIKTAKKIVKKAGIKNLELLVADAKKIPAKSNSKDLILARRTGLSDTNDWPKVLKEVKRLLRDKYSIFVYTVHRDFSKSEEKIKLELKSAGLNFIKKTYFKEKDGDKIEMIIAGVKIK